MKLLCEVEGTRAMIVGYVSTRKKATVKAVVILEGRLQAVPLDNITLLNLPEELDKVVKMPKAGTK